MTATLTLYMSLAVGMVLGYVIGMVHTEVRIARRLSERAAMEAHEVSEFVHHESEPPPPPNPEPGKPGSPPNGGVGGTGGRGGRGGIGLTGEQGAKGETGDDRDSPFQRRILALIAGIIFIGSIYYATVAQDQLDDGKKERADFKEAIACQQGVQKKTLKALKARSVFAEQQAEIAVLRDKAALTGDQAQRDFLIALSDPKSDGEQELKTYLTALDVLIERRKVAVQATQEQLDIRKDNPFPSLPDINECAEIDE